MGKHPNTSGAWIADAPLTSETTVRQWRDHHLVLRQRNLAAGYFERIEFDYRAGETAQAGQQPDR